ncbi:hypothetical protein [Pontibacter mucosus]|uniref:hypothetical protein n=1 Tax=Pontibacter mucosus TaxID=1649266 RepID=UPI0011B27486|nr:hypothetical protein [Pontibacter mucosus]
MPLHAGACGLYTITTASLMRGNQVATYQIVVAVTQFTLLFVYGRLYEGDFDTALMYVVIYWLPAVVYHALSGVPILFAKNSYVKSIILLSATFAISMVINEIIKPVGQDLYRLIITSSYLTNIVYGQLLWKKLFDNKEVTHNS